MAVEKLNEANAVIKIEVSNDLIDAKKEKVAKQIAKTAEIKGFRKGKAPLAIVKKMYEKQIEDEAINSLIQEEYEEALKELGIKKEDIIGEPVFTKFERGDEKTEIEIKISLKPDVKIEGYEEIIPEIELPQISEEDVENKIKEYAKEVAEPVDSDKEVVEKGDIAVIDFVGYIDDKEMENGSADNYPLEIGSNTFIPEFEEQIIGMKVGEEKEIKVAFPENYGAKEIAGKEAKFKVTLKKIQEKKVPEIDDELAKKLLQKDDADVEVLKDEIKKELLNVKKTELFTPKKAELAELLVEKIEFDLPDVIVDKETELTINQKAQSLTADEIKEISENEEKLKEFQEEAKKEAEKKVKLTFIIDELAKVENISVSDEEVLQLIYFDAIRNGQDAEQIFNYYKDNNLLPAVKMSILEDRVLTTLLDKKAK